MSRIKGQFWLLLPFLGLIIPVEPFPSRLRVKTVANITADTTTTSIPAYTLAPLTENVTDVIKNPLRKRQRPVKFTTTQKTLRSDEPNETTEENLEVSTATDQSKTRFSWRTVRNRNNSSEINLRDTPESFTGRGSGRRNVSDEKVKTEKTQPPHPFPRSLIKLLRNGTGAYNFETGIVRSGSRNHNVSNNNEISDQNISSNEIYKVKDDSEEPVSLKPKRFSSRYRGSRPGAPKLYARGNHQEPETENNEKEPTGLLADGDYRDVGSSSDPNQETYVENVEDEEHELSRIQEKNEEQKDVEEKHDGGGAKEEANDGEEVKEAKEQGEEVKEAKGQGEEHHIDHHVVKANKEDKGYKGGHQFHSGSKGFHDKEGHKGEYKDEKGSKKGHKEGGGHFEAAHHGEKGEKAAEHAEKEEYKKGHSTRGGHVVHKKDEFEKKIEFYDESHEDGSGEKFGAFFESHGRKKGSHKKGGHKNIKFNGAHHGKKGHFVKGSHHLDDKGHDSKEGKAGMYEHHEKHGKEGSKKNAKKYHYSKGKPTKKSRKIINHLRDDVPLEKDKTLDGEEAEKALSSFVDQKFNERIAEPDENSFPKIEERKDDGNVHFRTQKSKRIREDVDTPSAQEMEEIKKKYENAEYMDINGPTSIITRTHHSTTRLQDKQPHPTSNQRYDEVQEEPHTENYITEEKQLEEGEEALHILAPLHQGDDHEYQESRQGYQVNEPIHEEPTPQASQPFISRVHIQSSYHPIQIDASY